MSTAAIPFGKLRRVMVDLENKALVVPNISCIHQQVSDKISDNDDMFTGSTKSYFHGGQTALWSVHTAMVAAGLYRDWKCDPTSFLTMPCGYGRELRYFSVAYPTTRHVACDLVEAAVDFCTSHFQSTPVISTFDIDLLAKRFEALNTKYTVIWSGSFFTHLSEVKFIEYLDLFRSLLDRNGVALFTTHGRYYADVMRKRGRDFHIEQFKLNNILKGYLENGFGYESYGSRIFTADWGVTLTSYDWVKRTIENTKLLRLVAYIERGYGNVQDVWAFVKN